MELEGVSFCGTSTVVWLIPKILQLSLHLTLLWQISC